MRINYGCGRRVQPGFFNIDAQRNPKAPRDPELLHCLAFDICGRLVDKTPLDDEVADELHCYHLIEHFYRWESESVILEFRRLLKPGGKLLLECPDIKKACKNLLSGMDDQMSMWPLYGDPQHKDPYMCHKWGYTPETLTALLQSCGMKKIRVCPPKTHRRRVNRDMRIESIK